MGFLTRKPPSDRDHDMVTLLKSAQGGDREAREGLVTKYTPFVVKTVSRVTGSFVRLGQDDEVSIGLIAFDEAITKYEWDKNLGFLSFAETVIKRRLIDFFRKEKNNRRVIPMSQFEHEGASDENPVTVFEAKEAMAKFQKGKEISDRQEEIHSFNLTLLEFGISFAELVELSPKHEDARLRAMEVARLIAGNDALKDHLILKKELPLKHIETQVDISRKTLERQRKYIIALTLILVKDFTYLKEYMQKSLSDSSRC